MRFRTKRSPLPFISLLAVVFLLTAGPAFANPPRGHAWEVERHAFEYRRLWQIRP